MKNTKAVVRLRNVRKVSGPVALSVTAALLSGCIGAPTYGTGKAADQQLVEDVTGILSLGPKKKQEKIAYTPRAGIVMPPSTEVLPPPQEDVTSGNNSAWPESPEQRLARIRAEATENQNNPNYRAPVVRDVASNAATDKARLPDLATRRKQREEVLRLRAEQQQVSQNQRRYLSEPPAEYRAPAGSAPVGELGEDEAKKEREAKRAAQKKGEKRGLRDLWPW